MGGAEQFYLRLLRGLNDIGWPVTAISRVGTGVARALREESLPHMTLPLATQWDLYSMWRLRYYLKRQEPCVVQTYMGRATRLTRLARGGHAVHVARLGGYYKIDGYYRHAHAWIGNTRGICDYLVQSGLPASKVYYIGNFVPEKKPLTHDDLNHFRHQHVIPHDRWVLLALGRFVEYKGFDDLLLALSYLPKVIHGRPWLLLLAGEGNCRNKLLIKAKSLGIADCIRWLGWQNPPDLCYAIANAMICPSRIEPLGNVILEAWTHGVPVISTRTAGGLELIEHEETGLLCDVEDPRGLATQIQRLLSASEKDRQNLGASGRAYSLNHFSQSSIISAYTSLYASLLGKHGGH